jgi:type 2 lantibiotic biosynthesis protein LanM
MSMLSSQQRETILEIIARAASPLERRAASSGCTCFVPASRQDPALIQARTSAWTEAVAAGDRARFNLLLEARGISQDAFTSGLLEVSVKHGAPLPAWGQTLLEMLEDFSGTENTLDSTVENGEQRGRTSPMYETLRPFLGMGERFLRSKARSVNMEMSGQAETQILLTLARRLFSACLDVLENEMSTLSAAAGMLQLFGAEHKQELDSNLDAWLNRFMHYPVLARVVAVVYKNWRDHISELIERLISDRELLRAEIFSGELPLHLTNFWGDTGDIHEDGRSVALLEFEHGKRIAYKPKDLRIAEAFMSLVNFLNQSGLQLPLHVRKIVTREGYTWEQFIEHYPCEDATGVSRFYRRMGMMIRLLQLLGARDFWLDNLIASGEYPVFIDYEMVLQQRTEEASTLLPAEKMALDMIEESVVYSGIVSYCTPIDLGVKAEDMGALTPVRQLGSPFKLTKATASKNGINLKLTTGGYVSWEKRDYAPVVDGQPARSVEYLEAIIAGYREMHSCLLANKAALLSASGPLHAFAQLPIRYIHRDTWSCMKIIKASVNPSLLVDGVKREIYLEGLFKTVFDGQTIKHNLLRVVQEEIDFFRELDIPLFRSLPAENSVLGRHESEIENYFIGTALERTVKRVAELDSFHLEEHVDIIRSTLSSGPHEAPKVSTDVKSERNLSRPPELDGWLNAACDIGDFILKQSVKSPEEDVAWVGLVYHPHMDFNNVEVLRPDILSGTCGLAILFADLYALTGLTRFKVGAQKALDSTRHTILSAPTLFREVQLNSFANKRPLFIGAFYGLGGQVYALQRCAQAIDAPGLGQLASEYVGMLPLARLCQQVSADLVSGASGLMAALLPGMADDDTFASQILFIAQELVANKRERKAFVKPLYPPGGCFLDGLPDLAGGVAMSFSRLTMMEGKRLSAQMTVEIEELIQEQEQLVRAKNPTPGRLLSRLSISQGGRGGLDEVLGEIKEYVKADPARMCSRQLIDAFELVISAYQASNDEQFKRRAAEFAGQLIGRYRSTGSWLSDQISADRHSLSVITGIGAIAHALLRLHKPERIRSIRQLH